MDAGTLSGIAAIITALLLPFVTKITAGGGEAKRDREEAQEEVGRLRKLLASERRSGHRWFQLFVVWYGRTREERHGRANDRALVAAIPGAPSIQWPAMEPLPTLDSVIAESNRALEQGAD